MTIISSNIDSTDAYAYQTQETDVTVAVLANVFVSGLDAIRITHGIAFYNAGTIFAHGAAVFTTVSGNTSSGTQFENTPTGLISGNNGISSTENSDIVFNAGTIDGYTSGIGLQGDNSSVVNTGVINSGIGVGISMSGKAPVVHNYGSVHGGAAAVVEFVPAASVGYIVNLGTVAGVTYAAEIGGAGDVIFRNSGTLDGDILSVQTGSFTFDGRKGTAHDSITGGAGADRIFAGDDGETLGGGKGHDRLVGGAGADTFQFASFSVADSDVIRQFDVTHDTIQFDSSVFTHLKADTTPAFAIGTAASSAADFLFYNSGTGALYYDVDGSGSAHKPYLVATLDAGLKLTANNFAVT